MLAAAFREHSGSIMDGCMFSIFGFGITVCCPFKDDVERQND
jgi:hypothetical protein